MGQDVRDKSRVCRTPPGPQTIRLSTNTNSRGIILAASLITILSMAALSTYLFWLPLDGEYGLILDYGFITIDGDANFTATALLKGWPGDGSPEDPFIIDGLDIEIAGEFNHCISISNTRASFIISNCSLTGASLGMSWGAGIFLKNVANGELVHNTCHGHDSGIYLNCSDSNTVANNMFVSNGVGISFRNSDSNTVINNTFDSNDMGGITLYESDSNTVADNTFNSSYDGIFIVGSDSNTLANNTCIGDLEGIWLNCANHNTVVNNTCKNGNYGIFIQFADYNTVANNTCNSNGDGISIQGSYENSVVNNTCTSNRGCGITIEASHVTGRLQASDSNILANNICCNNRIGIYIYELFSNTLANNTYSGNTEHDILIGPETEEIPLGIFSCSDSQELHFWVQDGNW